MSDATTNQAQDQQLPPAPTVANSADREPDPPCCTIPPGGDPGPST